ARLSERGQDFLHRQPWAWPTQESVPFRTAAMKIGDTEHTERESRRTRKRESPSIPNFPSRVLRERFSCASVPPWIDFPTWPAEGLLGPTGDLRAGVARFVASASEGERITCRAASQTRSARCERRCRSWSSAWCRR